MSAKVDWLFLFSDTRARVYLLWAVLASGGFLATHYYQQEQINIVWTVISLIGLGYMYKVMPLQVKQMQKIFLSWFVPILLGIAISVAVFYSNNAQAGNILAHLGAFWLLVLSAGYFFNGLVDKPSGWYWFAAALNLVAGLLCYTVAEFIASQYLIAAIVSAWSMSYLWLFRADL